MSRLHHVTSGLSEGAPVVLLHGFGASHRVWGDVIPFLQAERRIIAYDLPGHGGSLDDREIGSAAVSARAVLGDLMERGEDQAHLVGHSMGGAAAAICALKEPERCLSLTLLAPGSFGSEINHRLLRRFASATMEAELTLLMEQFFGWRNPLPDWLIPDLVQQRRRNEAVQCLEKIVETFLDGSEQKQLSTVEIAALDIPIKVVWGTQDRVLPTRQAHKLPGRIAVHIFEEVGHMLPLEIAEDVAHLILENSR